MPQCLTLSIYVRGAVLEEPLGQLRVAQLAVLSCPDRQPMKGADLGAATPCYSTSGHVVSPPMACRN